MAKCKYCGNSISLISISKTCSYCDKEAWLEDNKEYFNEEEKRKKISADYWKKKRGEK